MTPPLMAPVRVLDLDPALARDLPPDAVPLAHATVVAPVELVDRGQWRPPRPPRDHRGVLGLLLLEGAVVRHLVLDGRDCAELLGKGDLLRPWEPDRTVAGISTSSRWEALEDTMVAVLDRRFAIAAARWPELLAEIAGRAVGRSRSLALNLAIAQLPNVEVRLLVLLWHLAERFGGAQSDDRLVPLQLTQQLLASLVVAQRQTVSSALTRLSERGLVARVPEGYRLSGEPPQELTSLRAAVA